MRRSHRRCSLIGISSCLGNSGGILWRSLWREWSLGGRGNIGRRGALDSISEGGLWGGGTSGTRGDRLGGRATSSDCAGRGRSGWPHRVEPLSSRLKEGEKFNDYSITFLSPHLSSPPSSPDPPQGEQNFFLSIVPRDLVSVGVVGPPAEQEEPGTPHGTTPEEHRIVTRYPT